MTGGGVIGIAGCGSMGLPMARQLHQAGVDVWGFDVRPACEFGDFENRMITNPQDFAARVDTVISVVRNWSQTTDLCFDVQKIFTAPQPPQTLVVSSTLSPRVLESLAQRLPHGTTLVDAPMSGAPYRAENGSLTFMVGGDEMVVSELADTFNIMGSVIHHLGPVGAGLTCKVINNFVAASSVVAVRRAVQAARLLGVDQRTMLAVMRTSSGGTWFGDNFAAIDWSGQGYDPENTIGILEKDMASFLDAMQGVADDSDCPFEQAILAGLRKLEVLTE